jgi:hypothetical protein
MRVRVLPYAASTSAKLLARAIGAKRLRLRNSRYRERSGDKIINWGNSKATQYRQIQNIPARIQCVVNKVYFFRIINEHAFARDMWAHLNQYLVPYTFYKDDADYGLAQGWEAVYCRTKLTGHSGEGIVVARNSNELVDAKLYTSAIFKAREYRVHVFNGKVILLQQKRRRSGVESSNEIKNHRNGWVYAVNNITPIPVDNYEKICIDFVNCFGLLFGAVDLLVKGDRIYVLEINTAPGLVGATTLNAYTQAVKEYINDSIR